MMTDRVKDRSDLYADEYLGRVFYYCLKKTGNEQDAAELASDIGFEVIKSLSRGVEPKNFETWVWAVVRNRWARWAKSRYCSTLKALACGKTESELSDSDRQNLSTLIKKGIVKRRNDGSLCINALVISADKLSEVTKFRNSLSEYEHLAANAKSFVDSARRIIAGYSVNYLKDDFDYYVAMSLNARPILFALLKDRGLYTGNSRLFAYLEME